MSAFKIIRPLNCIMILIATFCAMLVSKDIIALKALVPKIIPALLCALFIGAGGNVLNDYYDRDIDRINKPWRAIPSGKVTARSAKLLATLLMCLGIITAFLTFAYLVVAIALIASALLVSYEKTFKHKGLIGNLVISALAASLFLFGGAAVNAEFTAFWALIILAALAFLSTLSREIIKDIEDMMGDRLERETLPLKAGAKQARFVSAFILVIAVILSTLPYLLKIFDLLYLIIIAGADAIFIYSICMLTKRPASSSALLKYGMLVALAGFVISSVA
ncbi:MAG: UbiA family prenyltransferase [Candidatus Thermoplasmatota archaeon]|nr:UbiA family prenyltransferase [Candidatus Thermoplasmatota archaeon]